MPPLKKVLTFLGIGAVVVGVGIQFVPLKTVGTNPPARFKMDMSPEVEAIMRRACFDCHTNETRWPLYSLIAPGSWILERDVHNARNHLNFSEWGDVDEEERQMDLENCWDQVASGEMPPWFYIFPVHPDAKLSDADKALLKEFFLKGAKPAEAKPADDKPEGKPPEAKPSEGKPPAAKPPEGK